MKLYKEPAQKSYLFFFLGLSSLLIWTYVMSYVYAMFISVSPFIYINFIITLFYAVSIGTGAIIIGKVFKIKQKKNVILLAVIASILGVYFSWIATLYYYVPGVIAANEYFLSPSLLVQPNIVFQIISEINQIGFWSIFGVTFSGIQLTAIWLLEIALIIFIVYKLNANIEVQPFDYNSNKWFKKYHLHKDFESFSYLKEFSQDINDNPVEVLSKLGVGSAYSFGQVSIFHLKESDVCYLSLHNIGRNRNGKSESTKQVLLLLEISRPDADKLMEKFKFKRKWFLDF